MMFTIGQMSQTVRLTVSFLHHLITNFSTSLRDRIYSAAEMTNTGLADRPWEKCKESTWRLQILINHCKFKHLAHLRRAFGLYKHATHWSQQPITKTLWSPNTCRFNILFLLILYQAFIEVEPGLVGSVFTAVLMKIRQEIRQELWGSVAGEHVWLVVNK